MHLPLVQDLAQLIWQAGRGAYLHSNCCDIAHAYWQMPLDQADWPRVCFTVGGNFFTVISLTFGLRWAVASCHAYNFSITLMI